MKCEKISIKKLENNNIPGNYLFADEKNYYFNKYVRNSLFIKDKDAVVDTEKVDCYYDYLTQVVNVCKGSQNKPSVLYFGNNFDCVELTESETQNLNVNQESLYVKVKDFENFDEYLNNLIDSRSNSQFTNFKPVYIFVDDFSNISENNLARFLTVSRSRYIYFVLLIKEEKQFDEFTFEIVTGNCSLTFVYNQNGIKEVVNMYGDILDKDKKEFIKSK